MKAFNELCKEMEGLSNAAYNAILADKSLRILPALSDIADGAINGAVIFSTFILSAIAADGRVTEEEYDLCEPLLKAFFGDSIDYQSCKATIKTMNSGSRMVKKAVSDMVNVLGYLSEDLKNDVIFVCMIICAVDGKISSKEKRWLKQLI